MRKIIVLILVILLCMSSVVIFNINVDVNATGEGEGDEGDIGLNFSYIEEITEELSKVIFNPNVYEEGDLKKGRYFGSEGEHYAAFNILQDEMIEMGLYNPCLDSEYPYLEKIENINAEPYLNGSLTNLIEDLQPFSYGITIYDIENETNITLTDLHIEPTWNWRMMYGVAKSLLGLNFDPNEFYEFLEEVFGITDNYSVDMVYNESWLTKNVSYNNLKVLPRPTNFSWFLDYLKVRIDDIINNDSITDYDSLMAYIIPEFQDFYEFKFGELTPDNASDTFDWFNNVSWIPTPPPIGEEEDFLYIMEDNSHNPDVTVPYYFKDYFEDIENLLKNYSLEDYPILNYFVGGFINGILKVTASVEMFLWNLTMPHCKGVIKFNYENETYNTQGMVGEALNTLFINGSMGTLLNESKGDYTVSFWINQSWMDNVESYNVIGQINGTDQSKTVILSGLYDCWYNQGTVDGAIGTAIVMGIAKYMQDNSIKPKYNLKFIGFAGEEAYMRGAYYYDAKHYDEDIAMVIDLNQLGMDQDDPRLTLNVYPNNPSTNTTVQAITNRTQYVERLDDGSGFSVNDDNVVSNHYPFLKNTSRQNSGTGTICFLKGLKMGRGWRDHHRDGENHQEGDVFTHYYPEDVNLTAEMVLNVTRYYAINADLWITPGTMYIKSDSSDDDNFDDTLLVGFDVKSILPHDSVWVNISLESVDSGESILFQNYSFIANRTEISKNATFTLPETEPPGFYRIKREIYNSTGIIDEAINSEEDNTNMTIYSSQIFLYPYNYGERFVPSITNVTEIPDFAGYSTNITINADVTSNMSSIDIVTVNITYPNSTTYSFNMTNTVGDTYEYVFNDTWQKGQYDYVIWAKDVNGNESGSSQHNFHIYADVTLSVCTIKDGYGDTEIVNLTDPPGPGDGLQQIGYELLDDDRVLRIWNKFDNYYFNTSNGVQFSNHYNEYWSHNVLMLGYYNNNIWNLVYRTDELSGFNKNIESDDETYVNVTLWKDLSYQGYDFRLAVCYHLGVDDNELTVIPYIKNLGDEDISFDLGFAWEINDIQVDNTQSGDYIEIDGTSYYLNQELDEIYNNMASPCFYIRENLTNSTGSESLYLRWDENLNDIVRVKSRTGEYNAPVTLGIDIGTLSVGQEKYTSLFWHDASEVVYYFDNYLAGVEEWMTTPGYMVDNITSYYASTGVTGDVELCINNTCWGEYLGLISKVEIRAKGYYSGMNPRSIILRPVFTGGDGSNHYFTPPPNVGDWSSWFEITYDKTPPFWNWGDVRALDCDVESGSGVPGPTVYCSKVEIRVTYTPNQAPIMYNPVPTSSSIGVGIQPVLGINVFDSDGDTMNITWLSNSSGSWQVFGTNLSVSSGEYQQNFTNASVNGEWWYWKVNVSDGLNYTESSVYSFYTGYESKIKNIGSTDIMGYLLMQVQYYNNSSSSWDVALDTVNETSPRIINASAQLGLDTIFNGLVNTSNLSGFGNGTYRVYVAFRDPSGNVLKANSNSYIETTYEFTVTFD